MMSIFNNDDMAKRKGGAAKPVSLITDYYTKNGGGLIYSFVYSNSDRCLGDICFENGSFIVDKNTENSSVIDCVYVSKYRIVIVLMNDSAGLVNFSDWFYVGNEIRKYNPVAQVEKHARFLYDYLIEMLPDGRAEYIQPVCLMHNACRIEDLRTDEMKVYLPVISTDSFNRFLYKANEPLKYELNLNDIFDKLKNLALNKVGNNTRVYDLI